MGQSIGDLFVTLGVKGSEKTISALGGIEKGMGDVASVSLEAKAAILAVGYGIEQLVTTSAAAGQSLKNFETITGISHKTLEQYQFAARRTGATNEEMAGTFTNLQKVMTNAQLGKGAPESTSFISGLIGGIDIYKAKVPELFQWLNTFAQKKGIPEGLKVRALESFGLSPTLISGMMRGFFNPDQISKAPIRSDATVNALDKTKQKLSELKDQVVRTFDNLTAKHGVQLVGDLKEITVAITGLINSLDKLGTKFGIFERFNDFITGMANTLKLAKEVIDKINGGESKPGDLLYEKPGSQPDGGFATSPFAQFFKNISKSVDFSEDSNPANNIDISKDTVATPLGPSHFGIPQTINNNANINQTFNDRGIDHHKVGNATKEGVKHAFRQIPANQGN